MLLKFICCAGLVLLVVIGPCKINAKPTTVKGTIINPHMGTADTYHTTNGSGIHTATEKKKRDLGFFDDLLSIFTGDYDWFGESEETYLICRNCTVVVDQKSTKAPPNAATKPTQSSTPTTAAATTKAATTTAATTTAAKTTAATTKPGVGK